MNEVPMDQQVKQENHTSRTVRPGGMVTNLRSLLAILAAALPLFLAGCVGEVPEEVYADGRKAYDSLDFRKAEEKFAEFVRKYPAHEYIPPAYLWLAKARARLGDSTGAIEAFRKAEELAPEPNVRLDARVNLAQIYRHRQEWDPALEQLAGLVATTSGDVKRNFIINYATTLWESGRVEDASAYLHARAASADNPRHRGEYLLSLAGLYLSAEDYDPAVGVLGSIIGDASAPEHLATTAYMWRASALSEEGRIPEAEKDYLDLQERFPDSIAAIEADVELSVLFQKEDPEKADAYLRAATEAFADRVREATESVQAARLEGRLARAYFRVERYQDAIDTYERIREENPDDTVLQEQIENLIQEVRQAMASQIEPLSTPAIVDERQESHE